MSLLPRILWKMKMQNKAFHAIGAKARLSMNADVGLKNINVRP